MVIASCLLASPALGTVSDIHTTALFGAGAKQAVDSDGYQSSELVARVGMDRDESKTSFHLDMDLAATDHQKACVIDNRSDPRALEKCRRVSPFEATAKFTMENVSGGFPVGIVTGIGSLRLFEPLVSATMFPFAWNRFYSPLPAVNPAFTGMASFSRIQLGVTLTNDVTTRDVGEFNGSNMQPLPVFSATAKVGMGIVAAIDGCSYDINHSKLLRIGVGSGTSDGGGWQFSAIADRKRRRFGRSSYVHSIDAAVAGVERSFGSVLARLDVGVTRSETPEVCGEGSATGPCQEPSAARQSEFQLGLGIPQGNGPNHGSVILLQYGSFVGLDLLSPDQAACGSGGCGRWNGVRVLWTFKI